MVSFDETIPPGGEGKIRLHIDTSDYEGGIRKSIVVSTDDPEMPPLILAVKADIIAPISVLPERVYFVGKKNAMLKTEVKIKANLDKPLEIKPVSFDLADKVKYSIEELTKKRVYKIKFVKLPSTDEKINGKLKIKTNYSEKPYINIVIKGYFREE